MTPSSLRRCALAAVLAWSAAAVAQPSTGPLRYETPAPELVAIVDAARPPQLFLSPHRDMAALMQVPSLPGIDVVAQPELKLAGLRIHPRTHAQSRFSFGSDLWLLDLDTRKEIRIAGLPTPLAIAGVRWSPDQRHLAFNHLDPASGANELWVVELATHRARRIAGGLNAVAGRGYSWLPDSSGLFALLQPEGQGAPPPSDSTPTGPSVQETAAGGGVKQIRTYPDLLRNEADARVLEYYLRSQMARIALDGRIERIGEPASWLSAEPSPDGRYVLAQRVERPFSYLVPIDSFPHRIEVFGRDGSLVREIAALPLVEGLPVGNDAEREGVRSIEWRADAPATLVWAEAQDGGDPAREAAVRDHVLMQTAPFDQTPVVLARLAQRFGGVIWGDGDLALIHEYWWKTRAIKLWRVRPDAPQTAPQLLRDGSFEDRYNDPGMPVTVIDAAGNARLLLADGGRGLFLIGEGASPEGDRPFVDRLDLDSGRKTRLFHSQAPYYEQPKAVLDDRGERLLTTRESPTEPANYLLRSGRRAPVALTRFAHPTPQLKGVRKEQIRYKRKDGVDLTGTLYLPPGYDARRDGPLPLLMWAYPQEFKSADAAGQVTDSPYRFNFISYWGPQAFLARGYAVLDDPSMPIVGEGDAEPNDTYVTQLVAGAEAAIDEVVRRGVADRERIAVGGHSYGAFMTANLLAHTRLFRAGIARSGAYNRTLTPFGFQSEERSYWQAQPVYQAMSPFNYADRIKDPLLLIHGEQDNNSGTFPIQSERLFAAIKGLGGTARLVMLPNESHGYRARESVLQMLAETDRWLARYVKSAPPRGEKAAMP